MKSFPSEKGGKKNQEQKEVDLRNIMEIMPHRNSLNVGQPHEKHSRLDRRPFFGRVSPQARENIYHLHLQGWTIRDLSIKYGLIPERLKAIIYLRQYFYEEVMPKVSLTTIKLGLEIEAIYAMQFGFVDYGIDLGRMAFKEKGILMQQYRKKDVDINNVSQEVRNRMEKVLEGKKKKKYDIVTEKFVGQSGKGYFIKSWVVYKNHGAERVNKRFKDILLNANSPYRLPLKIQNRLHKGPRVASFGYRNA